MATPADIAADPNPITDPEGTGGAANFNILDIFQEFGYQPTEAEIQALSPSFSGTYDPLEIGTNAVAQYVNYQNQIASFNAKDPLTGLQTQMNNIITQNTASVTNLSTQLQNTLKSAPQLFGSLTPDQISQYLQPLQTSFNQQIAQVQAASAATGTAGSSAQAAALAQAQNEFQSTVLSTGLNIGLTSQKNQADALQQQINNLYGQTGQAMSITGAAAGQQSQQQLGESELIGSLPSFLNNQSALEEQIATAQNAQNNPSLLSRIMNLGNVVNAATNLGTDVLSAPGKLINAGNSSANAGFPSALQSYLPSSTPAMSGTPNYNPSQPLSLLQGNASSTSAEQYGFGSPSADSIFAATGSAIAG
jgi:hypothetical protein